MALTLPVTPSPREASVRLITARNELTPSFAGSTQRLNRKGSKYAMAVTMPPMTYADAMAWVDLDTETDVVILPVPQPGFDTGPVGTPLVNGGSQSGSSLIIDGLTPNYIIRKGQYFNVVTSSRNYLYRAAASVTANSSGEATISLMTMLRTPPANNDVIKLGTPVIEGFVTSDDLWTVDIAHLVGLSFTITERG